MSRPAVYNEIDPFCCDVLRARIADGSLPPGDVDARDIREVQADDYRGYGQIHLFAGIGGFGYAARLAGLPDGFDILTGGFPCQPWSVAGKHGGEADDRHLWPEMLRLVRGVRPMCVLGENVPAIDDSGYMALDGVLSDLEGINYAAGAVEIPACAVSAPHERNRCWIIGNDRGERGEGSTEEQIQGECGVSRRKNGREHQNVFNGWALHTPKLCRTGDGLPNRVDRLKSLGNAIVPQVAAEIMRAMREAA